MKSWLFTSTSVGRLLLCRAVNLTELHVFLTLIPIAHVHTVLQLYTPTKATLVLVQINHPLSTSINVITCMYSLSGSNAEIHFTRYLFGHMI